jgi:predicted Zn-dependent protease
VDIHTTVLGDNGSGWAQSSSNDVGDINVQETSARAFAIAQDAQSPADIDPGKYVVILRPAALQELLFYMICDAKATDEGRTFLRGKLGRKVCGGNVTIRSDPGDPRCPGPPFQDEGLALPKLSWIEKGVLTNLATSRFWAKKTGREPTGYPSNIIMDGGGWTVEEMVSSTERGILVTRFWYIRYVDPMESLVTGMTRDGLFLVEDGRVVRPIKQLRFNQNVVELLNRVEMLGQPERVGQCLVPAIKARDFNFTSTTAF